MMHPFARCTLTSISIAIISMVAPFTAHAAEAPTAIVGGGIQYTPEYSGSDKMRLAPALYADYSFGNGFFASTVRGLGYAYQLDSVQLSAALGYRMGRSDKDRHLGKPGSDYLKGMGSIDGAATVNLAASTDLFGVKVGAGAQIAMSGDAKGNTYSLQASYPIYKSSHDEVELSGTALYGDGKHAQAWYGVTAAQHASSGFKAYQAKSGFESFGASVAWTHKVDNHWSVRTAVGLTTLVGDAADSPITRKKTAPGLVSTINYAF
jgi:outer membrane protein